MRLPLNWSKTQKWGKRIAFVLAFMYLLDTFLASLPRTPTCPVEEHIFEGKKLDVEFCLNHVSDRQYIGLRVYSKSGELLARRWATFANESRLNYMAIEDTMIRYSDDPLNQRDSPADCVLNMPPTWVDWLEARLPGGIPGVNHCGKASYEEVSRAQDLWELRVAEQEKKKRSQPSPLPETTGASR